MLRELAIRNLAVVEDAVIPFGEGLNVLTGSTGAGKSIILSAVELLSGSRVRRSMIRRGADTLNVGGTFGIPADWEMREELGMEAGDGLLEIKREFNADGRGRIWINGMLATNALARRVTGSLFELHGQHQQQELLDPATHIAYLDARGEYGDLLERCGELVAQYRDARERLAELEGEQRRHREQEDYYRFQLSELEQLALEPNLDRELERRIRIAENGQRYGAAMDEALTLLSGDDDSILDRLSRVERSLESLRALDPSWEEALREVADFRIAGREIARAMERRAEDGTGDAEEVELLQARLAAIQRVGRKHGLDCNGLIARREELRAVLRSLTDGSDEMLAARRRLDELAGTLVPLCGMLGERRRECAALLDREVSAELDRLGMKGAHLRTVIESAGNNPSPGSLDEVQLSARGWDRVEFLIRTNVGEEEHPLHEIASGGELSRITLVLKELQVDKRSIPTLVFDEIDAGLGADLGAVVAERMSELAKRYQIVCITHLPQIAARAAHHIRVSKRVRGGRTSTVAAVVQGRERIEEIARMLGGGGSLRMDLAAELLATTIGARSSDG